MHNVNRGRERREGQRVSRSGPSEEDQSAFVGTTGTDMQSVDLNHATALQLEAIDELGPELARALVEHRVHHGHFTSWDQVASIAGMDQEKVAALQRAARIVDHGEQPSADRAHRGEPLQRGGLP